MRLSELTSRVNPVVYVFAAQFGVARNFQRFKHQSLGGRNEGEGLILLFICVYIYVPPDRVDPKHRNLTGEHIIDNKKYGSR